MKIDNSSELQSDKEANINKTTNTFESLSLLTTTCNATGYDSDSCKPVKVKSRWRRSSELEMGGSNTGAASTSTVGSIFGSITANISEFGSCSTLKSSTGVLADINSSESTSGAISVANFQSNVDIEQTKEVPISTNNNNIVQIPKIVGARISLPMVSEIEDREMEERLSQFENLRENLYLTERYVNKFMDTKI